MMVKRELNDVFFTDFAEKYNALKEHGKIPVAICDAMCEYLDCGKTTYYYYLREAREKGFIKDSYKENMTARRQRDQKLRYDQNPVKVETVEPAETAVEKTVEETAVVTEVVPEITEPVVEETAPECDCEICVEAPLKEVSAPAKKKGLIGFILRFFGIK